MASISPDSAIRILSAGASLRVDGFSPDTLVRLATMAKSRNVRLEIKDSLSADSMVRIASAAPGLVLFDVPTIKCFSRSLIRSNFIFLPHLRQKHLRLRLRSVDASYGRNRSY